MRVHLARDLSLFQVLEKLGGFALQGHEWILLLHAWVGTTQEHGILPAMPPG